ncbi:MAG: GPP34 family phosphoprotein [Candidatus Lokiarchaeota archaeon]|nr:GPP34 family phosphoprotein [Candidatus Lokiarchaeota archaeon]
MNGGDIKILISKSYLLVVLNEQKGVCDSKGFESLGFAGALLMDLFLQGKINITEKSIEIINSSSTEDEFLDQILEIIGKSEKKRSLMKWIDELSKKYEYYYLYFDLMEQQGILKSEINQQLKRKLYFLQKPEIKSQLLEEIQNVVNNNKEPSTNIISLLVLLEESQLIKVYLPRDLRKRVRNRIKEILYSEQLDSLSREMIFRIKKEIVNVIGARNMFMTDRI